MDKDWNNLPALLMDLNEIESFNLQCYLSELEIWKSELCSTPILKKVLVTMNSKYDEAALKKYMIICAILNIGRIIILVHVTL